MKDAGFFVSRAGEILGKVGLLHIRGSEGYNLSIEGKVTMKDCSVEPPDCSTDRPPISVEKVAVAKLPTKRGDFMIARMR